MLDGRSPGSRGIPQPLRLEPADRRGERDAGLSALTGGQHPEGGILGQSLGVVGVLVAPQTTIDGKAGALRGAARLRHPPIPSVRVVYAWPLGPFNPPTPGAARAPRSWCRFETELIAHAPYYDQPAFIREFRRFTGMTPTAFLEHRRRYGAADPSFLPVDGVG